MKNKILAMCLALAVLLQSSVMLIGAAETEVKSVDAEPDVVVMDSEEESTLDMPQEQEELELEEPETDSIQSDIEVEIIEIPNENESFEEETTIEEDDANQEPLVVEESTEISSEEPEEIPGEEEPVDTETESGEEITEEPNTNEQEEPEATETQDESLEESESSEVTDVDGELVQSNETEKLNINRSNVVDGDFFADIEIYIEHNSEATVGPIYGDDEIGLYNSGTNELLSVNDEVYDTAPAMISATSLHASASSPELNGIRFKATVTPEQKAAAIEYGFLFASTDALQNHNLDLSFGITEITYKSGVNYSVADGVDKYLSIDESGNYVFSIVVHSIPESAYVKGITARPYIIYNIDEVETIVYGNTFSNCLYRTAKDEVVSSDDEVVVEFAQSIIDTAENMSTCLDTAVEVHLDERIDRSIGINPDIDVITFTPEVSCFYTLAFTSEEEASYEVLDESECELTKIEINNITNETAYLFEESQNYYIRVKGEPNTDYSIQATPCLANAIYYDFSNDTEGFTFGGGATGVAENGVLNLSINKSALTSKAYMQNTDLSIDLFDYSRLIIRMKNTTDTTNFSGTVGIDLEYDGTSIDYTLESSMPANMTEFENIEFDFTTRYGNVSSLKLSFGQLFSALSGNIYIDSIIILPMPEVLAWEFDETLEGWSKNTQIDSATIEGGALILDMLGSVTGMAPAITSPGTSAYDFNKYNILKIRLKNETTSNNMQVYFSTLANGHTSFNENKKFIVDIEPLMDEYVEYTIYLNEHSLFTDSLKDIMISFPAEGVVSIDYIRLYKNTIIYDDIIWDFDTDLEGFYSGSERHALSINNGALIVETISGTGGFYTPSNIDVPTSEYKYLVLGVKSASATTDFQAYFKTNTMTSYAETDHDNKIVYKHTLQIEQSDVFREYMIDLSSVPEGYTTGYAGTLEQLMLAFPDIGTYEIDYIKLTDGNVDEEFPISTTKNAEYKLLITKNNNCSIGTYTVKYDADVFELVDACVFTYPLETEAGQAAGTDITIKSVAGGTITFTISNKTAAGAINCLKLKAIKSIDSQIIVTTNVA